MKINFDEILLRPEDLNKDLMKFTDNEFKLHNIDQIDTSKANKFVS